MSAKLPAELREKLLSKTAIVKRTLDSPCWEFIGARTTAGYGSVSIKGQRYYVHRLIYELSIGPIPQGQGVLHRCDNPSCCNPEHLFLGTQKDNMADCIAKGRYSPPPSNRPKGEMSSNAKLTNKEAANLKWLAQEGQLNHTEIAEMYGVTRENVRDIAKGKIWGWLEPVEPEPTKWEPTPGFKRRI